MSVFEESVFLVMHFSCHIDGKHINITIVTLTIYCAIISINWNPRHFTTFTLFPICTLCVVGFSRNSMFIIFISVNSNDSYPSADTLSIRFAMIVNTSFSYSFFFRCSCCLCCCCCCYYFVVLGAVVVIVRRLPSFCLA